MKSNLPKIMSPAGSFESLAAALRSGAEAVYFGVGDLNMRSNATANFQKEDLSKVVRLCRAAKCKAYLTLNIVVFDTELSAIEELCQVAKQADVDAVIVSDPAAIMAAKRAGLSVHISVQANVCNIESVRYYSQFADLIVLARELPLHAIKKITSAIKCENITGPSGNLVMTEVFVHGALCAAFSGKCYMSLTSYNASANRGACLQNCRRQYKITDLTDGKELEIANGYIMSAADLCMIRYIPELCDAGVDVLKIEGRGRSADYVAKVTTTYQNALKAYANGEFNVEQAEEWREDLKLVFNRNFWDGGYYLGEEMGVWSGTGGNQSPRQKLHAGKVTAYFTKIGVAELSLEAAGIKLGDKLLIVGNTTGALELTVTAMRCQGVEIESAEKGAIISLPVPEKLRTNDKVYLIIDRKFGEAPVKGAEKL